MIERVLLATIATASLATATPADHVRAYVDRVIAGDLAAAAACWRDEDLASSQRLAIHYPDQPFKVDGDSPLWRALDALRSGVAAWSVTAADSTTADLVLREGDGEGALEVKHHYDVVAVNGGWRLASPVTLAMDALPARSGQYVCLRGGAVTTLALLDSCVVTMAGQLQIPSDRLADLERAKLAYLVATPSEVECLAGAPTVGVANLQHDVVITSHPCHAHELAHLVVNAWLRELPLFTLPLLQEGAATHLGGRWGRHPHVLDRDSGHTLTFTIDRTLVTDIDLRAVTAP